MPINIQSLFSDIIETPAQRQERMLTEGIVRGRELTRGLTGLAATQAPLVAALSQQMPRRQDALRRGVGGMLGLDVRTTGEKTQDALRGIDTNSVSGLIEAAKRVEAIPGLQSQALGLRQAAAELSLQKKQDDLRDQQIQSEKLGQQLTRLQLEKANEQNVTEVANYTWQEGETRRYARGGIKDNKVVIWDGSNWISAPADAVQVSAATGSGASSLSAKDEELITGYENEALSAGDELNNLSNFLLAFEEVELTPGIRGQVERSLREFLGQQDEENQIVQMLNAIVNKRAIDNLPRGAASDTDVALVLRGEINPNNATPEQVRAYINIARAIEAQKVIQNEEKAKYVAETGGTLGLSRHMNEFSASEEGAISALEAQMMQRYPFLYEQKPTSERSEAGQNARAALTRGSSENLDQGVQNVSEFLRGSTGLTPRSGPIATDPASVLGATRNPMLRP